MNSTNDLTREVRNAVYALCNSNNIHQVNISLDSIRDQVEYLESIGAHGEVHVLRHSVAAALRELEALMPNVDALRSTMRELAGTKAINIANAPVRRIER